MKMLCGQSNPLWHYAAGRWPGKVGLLLGPKHFKRTSLRPWLPYVLDNDAFTLRDKWDKRAWFSMLEWAKLQKQKPEWVLVPDAVGSRGETLSRWKEYSPYALKFGWPLAFAVQDGMTPDDVPLEADVVFVGGTTEFKWRTVETWAENFNRVHVGRVNSIERLWQCEDLRCESVDGTGWFRDPTREDKLPALIEWLNGSRRAEQMELAARAGKETK